MLQNREILLGVCGGVAAYKSADLASQLVQDGAIGKGVAESLVSLNEGDRFNIVLFNEKVLSGLGKGLARDVPSARYAFREVCRAF